jgi:hypothetical protein
MTRATSIYPLQSEFDNFLFAQICEDRNGTRLSVLSALARLDVDPWQEADELAQLSGETASRRLASMIAALPDGPSGPLDSGTVATRLIELLPRRASSNIVPGETLFGIGAVADLRGFLYAVVIFIALVLGTQWIIATHQPPAQGDNAAMPGSGNFVPQMPPTNSGQ